MIDVSGCGQCEFEKDEWCNMLVGIVEKVEPFFVYIKTHTHTSISHYYNTIEAPCYCIFHYYNYARALSCLEVSLSTLSLCILESFYDLHMKTHGLYASIWLFYTNLVPTTIERGFLELSTLESLWVSLFSMITIPSLIILKTNSNTKECPFFL
jgi:hypothetical protein